MFYFLLSIEVLGPCIELMAKIAEDPKLQKFLRKIPGQHKHSRMNGTKKQFSAASAVTTESLPLVWKKEKKKLKYDIYRYVFDCFLLCRLKASWRLPTKSWSVLKMTREWSGTASTSRSDTTAAWCRPQRFLCGSALAPTSQGILSPLPVQKADFLLLVCL